jgi:beta-alanine degradation protein BauB
MAADPVEVAPNVYSTLFENERVRLLEARLAPGDSSRCTGIRTM